MSRLTAASITKPERYHHGDLRNALLAAAQQLIQENGLDGFSLREVAKRAKVSPAAMYHHFGNKNDLLRSIATEAFGKLNQILQKTAEAHSNPLERIVAVGEGYVRFAYKHHIEFRFMFKPELCAPPGMPDTIQERGQDAYGNLQQLVQAAQNSGHLKRGNTQALTLSLWSCMHGVAVVFLESPLSQEFTQAKAEETARATMRHLLDGIRAKPKTNITKIKR